MSNAGYVLLAAVVGCLLSPRPYAQVSCQQGGSMTYCSDGASYQRQAT